MARGVTPAAEACVNYITQSSRRSASIQKAGFTFTADARLAQVRKAKKAKRWLYSVDLGCVLRQLLGDAQRAALAITAEVSGAGCSGCGYLR